MSFQRSTHPYLCNMNKQHVHVLVSLPSHTSLQVIWVHDDFKALTQYPVIVEMWKHTGFGTGRRKFTKTFNPEEIDLLMTLEGKFSHWMMSGDFPEYLCCPLTTVPLLQRASQFFAEL